jgi:iron complex outermembrane receptor protein
MRFAGKALRIAPFLALASVLLAGSAAQAAPNPADTMRVEGPPVQVSASRPLATPGGASAVETKLDSGLVRPAPTIEQVLREMPLVVIRTNSRGEAQPALRGAEDRQIAVLLDGIPITLGWDARTDLSVVPLTGARDIKLYRGLPSVLLGPNSVGGAVEVRIASGSFRTTAPRRFTVDAGVDQTGAGSLALAGGALRRSDGATWELRGGGGYRGGDGFALAHGLNDADPATLARLTGDGGLRLNTDVSAFDGFLALRRESPAGTWISLTGTGFRIERGVAPEAHTTEPRLWRYPFQARGIGAFSAGTGMRDTPWGRGDVEASFGVDVGRTEIDEYDALDYSNVVGGENDDDVTLTARLIGDHTLGKRGDLRTAFTFADVNHDEVIGTGPPASYEQRLWSLAGETEWRIGLGAVPLRLSVGGAADGADTPESSDKPPLGRLWEWGGRAGATAVLAEGRLLAHGATSRRARFPSLRELYSGALGRFQENPDLRPEIEWVNELGVTVRRGGSEVQLAGFHQVIEDAIVRISVGSPSGNKFMRLNGGRIRGNGFEAVGSTRWGSFTAGADLTWQHVRGLDASGAEQTLEYEPDLFGGLSLEAPLVARARIGAEMHAMSEEFFIDPDTGTMGRLAPSVRFDLRLVRSFELGAGGPLSRMDAALSVENLADQTVYDQAGLPQPGRTIRLQARVY